ncbi:MAG: molecular chaperone HtpG [Oscillospiraceae bacterium]|nr:molecular chaperone HtpG [Oscillospiraceae bacterium]
MAKKAFKAESRRLLDLLIHSIYTQKEIFLRELISNASDALDKRYYLTLSDENQSFDRDSFQIRLAADQQARTLTVADTGVGMTKEELESNLGTIARSGSLDFKESAEPAEGVDIIGQFGVGFYAAFMVAKTVTVRSRSANGGPAHEWRSEGPDGYTVKEIGDMEPGTEIVLLLKDNTEEEKYDEFLEAHRLSAIVKKYSDFIKYPIRMSRTRSRLKEGSESEYEDYTEDETLNSMVPIWRKNKNELTDEDYERFYTDKRFGFDKPLRHAHVTVDGAVSYTALLYIPEKAPFDFYTREYEKGLELYTSGVLIMQKCPDLLPDYFSFVKGLVDSADLSLNISREMLQHDRQLRLIAKRIQERVKSELLSMLKNDREKYAGFFESFGRQLKYGVYSDWGANKDVLQDLLLFSSSDGDKPVTLEEYAGRMKPEQKNIYYAAGDSVEKLKKLPQTELLSDKGIEILYFTDDVDEFAVKMLGAYQEKPFKNVSDGDLEVEGEPKAETAEEDKAMFSAMKEKLSGGVIDVRASARLKSHPCCLATEGGVSIEMEKVLSSMPGAAGVKAEKVLEINAGHAVFTALKAAYAEDEEKFSAYTRLLYNQALLIDGLSVEDPVAFANDICALF